MISELVSVLGFKVDASGAREFDNLLNQIAKRADALTTGVGISIGNKLADMAISLAFGIKNALADIPKAGDEMNSAIQKIKSSLGESAIAGGEAVAIYEKLYSTSLITGIGANDSAQAFTQLNLAMEDMKRPASDTIDMLIGLQAAGTVAGQSAGDVKESIRQLGQAFGKGKLDGDELRSIAERMPRFLREIQKEMGVTTAQFFDMSSKGKLTPEALTDPFLKVSKRFFDEMLRMPVSMSRAFTILGLVTQRFSADLDRALGLSRAIASAVQFLSRTIEGMRGGLSVIGDFIRELGGLHELIKFIGIALLVAFGSSILSAFSKLVTLADFLAAAFGRVLLPLGLVILAALAIEDFISWMQGKDTIIGRVFGEFDTVIAPIKPQVDALKKAFEDLFNSMNLWDNTKREWQGFKDFFVETWESIKKAYNSAVEGMRPQVEWLIGAAEFLMAAFRPVGKFFSDVFSSIGQALKAYYDLAMPIINGIIGGIEKLLSLIPGFKSATEDVAAGSDPEKQAERRKNFGQRGAMGDVSGFTGGTMEDSSRPNVPFFTGGMMENLARPIPDVTGRVGSTTNNNNASQSNNITNDITINAPAGDAASITSGVTSGMGQATEGMITRLGNSMALGLGISSPRIEAPAMP